MQSNEGHNKKGLSGPTRNAIVFGACCLLPFILGVVVEYLLPGLVSPAPLLLIAVLALFLAFLVKRTDDGYDARPIAGAGFATIFVFLGAMCFSLHRVNGLRSEIAQSDSSVLIAHIKHVNDMGGGNLSCDAEVYYLSDSLLTIDPDKMISCRMYVDCVDCNLTEGAIIAVPNNLISTDKTINENATDALQYLCRQGISAVCRLGEYRYITHVQQPRLRDAAFAANGFLKSELKKTRF